MTERDFALQSICVAVMEFGMITLVAYRQGNISGGMRAAPAVMRAPNSLLLLGLNSGCRVL
ncbi:hypothetical protein [Martelella mangrovi]|uniref:Uncharacterized protein n=1 Tax=Martelella mangrovi TaxID=1397477 RepID=A0ABV2I792_9HYPH|nr:hypothetical protein [uncultured Martelella sp.]